MDTITAAMQITGIGECKGKNYQIQQLIPGLPDEGTLCNIVPELHWRAFHDFAVVRCPWRQAIQEHRVIYVRILIWLAFFVCIRISSRKLVGVMPGLLYAL
jgi:hypothetical protein